MLCSGTPPVCKCDYCTDKTPCSSGFNSAVWDASNLTPPARQQRRHTRNEGVMPTTMETGYCKSFFPKLQRRYRCKIPSYRSCRENGTEGDFLSPLFYTVAPECVSIRRLACASRISRPCCKHCDESAGQSASPARPVDIPWRSSSFVYRCVYRRLFLRPILD